MHTELSEDVKRTKLDGKVQWVKGSHAREAEDFVADTVSHAAHRRT